MPMDVLGPLVMYLPVTCNRNKAAAETTPPRYLQFAIPKRALRRHRVPYSSNKTTGTDTEDQTEREWRYLVRYQVSVLGYMWS